MRKGLRCVLVMVAFVAPGLQQGRLRAEPELIEAFAFGSRLLDCPTASVPDQSYTIVFHGTDLELEYDEGRGWGYEVIDEFQTGYFRFGPFDDSANNRGVFGDNCPEQLYDSFIGAKTFTNVCNAGTVGNPDDSCEEGGIEPQGIIFRVDVPNGLYRFVAAVGSADNLHASRIVAEDGGEGPPVEIGENHVVLVHNHNQAEHGAGNFARVGFGCYLPPLATGPRFTDVDGEGLVTADGPDSPILEVTEGYIRLHQLQGNSNDGAAGTGDANGGNMVILELWQVENPEDGAETLPSVARSFDPNPRGDGEEVTVTLSATSIGGPTTIVETIPAGWSVVDAGGGTVAGEEITFNVTANGDITYRVMDDGACGTGTFSGEVTGTGDCAGTVSGDLESFCTREVTCDASQPTLVQAFHFGSRRLDCETFNDPDVHYETVFQGSDLDLEYDEARGWGYEVTDPGAAGYFRFGPFDDSANNRTAFGDSCPEELFDSFIGGKTFAVPTCSDPEEPDLTCEEIGIEPDGIIFRADVCNGRYRFVAVVGSADNPHVHRILAENGGEGPPVEISDEHVVLVHNFDQGERGAGTFAHVGFEDYFAPEAVGPGLVSMDADGYAVEDDDPDSPVLEVTEGFIRIHQLQGNSWTLADVNGGDLVLLELWRLPDAVTGASLRPGDVNGDGNYNVSDPVAQLGFQFSGGELPACFVVPDSDPVTLTEAGSAILDFNGDGDTNIADAVGSLGFLFSSGAPPALGEACAVIAGPCTEDTCN